MLVPGSSLPIIVYHRWPTKRGYHFCKREKWECVILNPISDRFNFIFKGKLHHYILPFIIERFLGLMQTVIVFKSIYQ